MSEDETRDRLTRLEVQMTHMIEAQKDLRQSHEKSAAQIKWAVMIVLGAVITAVLQSAGIIN